MSIEYQEKGLVGLYCPEDMIEFSVHVSEMRGRCVQEVPVRLQVGYKCMRHIAKKKGEEWNDVEVEGYYGNLGFYASLLRFHDNKWIPPLLKSAWRELNDNIG